MGTWGGVALVQDRKWLETQSSFSSVGILGGPAPAQLPSARSRAPLELTQPERAWYRDSPGASPGTGVQNVRLGSWNRDREA